MFLLPGTVSLWNAKALRAAAGSAFRLPVLSMSPQEVLDSLRSRGVRLLAATPRGGASPAGLASPVALLLGNEGAGLSPWWIEAADERVTISCPGAAESLNAAVAGGVLLYEAARQRREAAIAPANRSSAKARR
jgi:TrmH family RNA methyltransferase